MRMSFRESPYLRSKMNLLKWFESYLLQKRPNNFVVDLKDLSERAFRLFAALS